LAEIFIPKFGGRGRDGASVARTLRDPELHKKYVAFEKIQNRRQSQKIFQKYKNRKQLKKSELWMEMVVPARLFYRWQQEDPHFWEDDNNVKRIIKDNPELQPWK
jgi:hypothetical protein|tara:strand:+ start:961 stop:1275 length:315 start_codon:yes stop_codon:yes gene_type:complete